MTVSTASRTVAGAQLPAPGAWQIEPAHSHVEFSVRHLMGRVRGRFDRFEGTIDVAEAPEQSSVAVRIDAASIDTREANRDAHLRSPDFLDVERFPALTFRTTAVEGGGDRWKVTGDLTIREVTRPATLDVRLHGVGPDPFGNTRAFFSASTEIDREEFGLTWNQVLETGSLLVGRTVRIELEVQAVKA